MGRILNITYNLIYNDNYYINLTQVETKEIEKKIKKLGYHIRYYIGY